MQVLWCRNATPDPIPKGSCVKASASDDDAVVLCDPNDLVLSAVALDRVEPGAWGSFAIDGTVEVLVDDVVTRGDLITISGLVAGQGHGSPAGLFAAPQQRVGEALRAGGPGLVSVLISKGLVASHRWSDLDLTGSSLADLSTKSAGSLDSGTLDGDRLPSMSVTKRGGVPATGVSSGRFLCDDGTWKVVAASANGYFPSGW